MADSPKAFVIFAGPVAWFAELIIGYASATALPRAGLLGLAVLCLLIALWAFLSSMGTLRRQSGLHHSTATAGSRPRFAALWGAALGGGFFVATLLTGVGLVVLPRCGG